VTGTRVVETSASESDRRAIEIEIAIGIEIVRESAPDRMAAMLGRLAATRCPVRGHQVILGNGGDDPDLDSDFDSDFDERANESRPSVTGYAGRRALSYALGGLYDMLP